MRSDTRKAIGIVGGVGPYAGLDLNQKIFASTITTTEQDHLQVYLLSCSSLIEDRTEYLLNPDKFDNPGEAILHVVEKLSRIGAGVVGVPCNTSHCTPIFDVVEKGIAEAGLSVKLLHMIRETSRYLRKYHPEIERIGLLATRGTYHSGIYSETLQEDGGIDVLVPPPEEQERVHAAIYHRDYGIKNHPNPISKEALGSLTEVAEHLVARGAQGIIMGCTEIPLALRPVKLGVPKLDTTLILARALIENVDPSRLAPIR